MFSHSFFYKNLTVKTIDIRDGMSTDPNSLNYSFKVLYIFVLKCRPFLVLSYVKSF
jgi:hypothetical protein